jgi:hypothetical protein
VSTPALVELYRRGEVEPGALLWRAGMAGWLPPYDVPEVSEALHGQGVHVPGSHLDAGFEDDEEATRVAMSPLLPGSIGGSGGGPASLGTPDDAAGFGDEEVTRAIDSSALASPGPLTAPGQVTAAAPPPAPRLPPIPRGPSSAPVAPSARTAPTAARETPAVVAPPPPTGEDSDEATRIFDTSRLSSSPAARPEQDDEATRVYDSAAHAAPAPEPASAPRPPSAPPERLDPSFLGPATPPPEEAPRRFTAESILSVPPPEEASDVSGVDQPFLAVQRTSVSWRPPQPQQRRWGWLLVPTILAAGVAVALWQRPEWVELGRTQVLTWMGRPPAPEDPHAHLPPFDTERVGVVLEEAARTAQRCKLPDGPTGYGRVHVKFVNTGRAQAAQVSEPFAGTEVGECLVALFAGARMPPFSGKAVIVAKNFSIE